MSRLRVIIACYSGDPLKLKFHVLWRYFFPSFEYFLFHFLTSTTSLNQFFSLTYLFQNRLKDFFIFFQFLCLFLFGFGFSNICASKNSSLFLFLFHSSHNKNIFPSFLIFPNSTRKLMAPRAQ